MDFIEQGVTRRHTFFCVDRERHTGWTANVVAVEPKQIIVFGREVQGWVVTTEEPVIDKVIPLSESLAGTSLGRDPE